MTLRVMSLLLLLLTSSCAMHEASDNNPDPFEQYNRNAYRMNNKLDDWALKPVARTYNTITPKFVRTGVTNFFANLGTIPTIFNDLLQARVSWFFNDTWRLIFNSTVGVAGLFDVATSFGLEPHRNTFGMTFETWGAKPSPYVMLPGLGPSTLTETVGLIPNYFTGLWYMIDAPDWVIYTSAGVGAINTRALLLEGEQLQQGLTLDPYLFMQSAYLQNRAYVIRKNKLGPGGNANKHEDPDFNGDDPH